MSIDHQFEEPTAFRTNLGAIFVSLELSRLTWLITSLSPGGVHLWRVAPVVRLRAFAIFATGSWPRRRRSSFDQIRRACGFLVLATILAMLAPNLGDEQRYA